MIDTLERHAEAAVWKGKAACLGADLARFFPARGADCRAAKEVCKTCPVQAECLEYGIDERFGVWGGTDPAERRRLRRIRAYQRQG